MANLTDGITGWSPLSGTPHPNGPTFYDDESDGGPDELDGGAEIRVATEPAKKIRIRDRHNPTPRTVREFFWAGIKINTAPDKPELGGKPYSISEEKLALLEAASLMDCSMGETCLYVGVSFDTLKRWLDRWPKLRERVEMLRETPAITARNTIVKSLKETSSAMWYLERKKKK